MGHDSPGFLAGELERRRALRYPPFSELIRIELASPDATRLETVAGGVAAALRDLVPDDAQVLGPAPRFRLRGRHRRQVLIKAGERDEAVAAVGDAVDAAAKARRLRGVALSVDVDPQ
jgi:primosomal protein N' (replication factor Y)